MTRLASFVFGTLSVLILTYSVLASSFNPLIDWLGPIMGFQLRFLLGSVFLIFGNPAQYMTLLISWLAIGTVIGLFARRLDVSLATAFIVYAITWILFILTMITVFAPFFLGARPELPPVPAGISFGTLIREPVFNAVPGFMSGLLSGSGPAHQTLSSLIVHSAEYLGENFALLMITAALVGFTSQWLIQSKERRATGRTGFHLTSSNRLRVLTCIFVATLTVSAGFIPAASAQTTSHSMNIMVTESGTTYQAIIDVPSSNYETEYSTAPYSSYPATADKSMIADCSYLTGYLSSDSSDYPIGSAEVVSNGAIVDTQTASPILASVLEYCELLALLGSNSAVMYNSQQATSWSQDYQNAAFSVNLANDLTEGAYYASIIGPILDAASNALSSSGKDQVEAAISLYQALTEGYQSLEQQYPNQASSILGTLGLTEGYNPSSLANTFLSSSDEAASYLSMVEQQDFGVTWVSGVSGEVSKFVSAMDSTVVDSLPVGAVEGLSAYFGAGLTLSTSIDVGVTAAVGNIADGVPLALGGAILQGYDLPMATALYNSWQEMGNMANLFSSLSSDGQTFADPTTESLPTDATTVTNAFYDYGIWETSLFFYFLDTYLYLAGEFLNPNADPSSALMSAQSWYASAEQWKTAIEDINSDASMLVDSSTSSPITISSGSVESAANGNVLPTIPAGDGFAVYISGATQASLTEGSYSFTVANGQWSSSFLDSFFVVDPSGNWYLIVDDPPSGQGSVTTSTQSEIKLIDFQSTGSTEAAILDVQTTNAESFSFTIYGTYSQSGPGYSESIVALVNPNGSASSLYSFVSGSIPTNDAAGSLQSDLSNSAFTLILAQSGGLNFLPAQLTQILSVEAALVPQILVIIGYTGSCQSTTGSASQEASELQSSLGLSGLDLLLSSPLLTSALLGSSTQGVGCIYFYYSSDAMASLAGAMSTNVLPIVNSAGLIDILEQGLTSGFLVPGATSDSVNAIGLAVGFGNLKLLADLLQSMLPFAASTSPQPSSGLAGFAVAVTQQQNLVFSSSMTHKISLSQLIGYTGSVSFSPDSSSSVIGIGTPAGGPAQPFPLGPLTGYHYDLLARTNSTSLAEFGPANVTTISAAPATLSAGDITTTFTGLFPADVSFSKSVQGETDGTVQVQIFVKNIDTEPISNLTIDDSAFISAYRGEINVVSGSPDDSLPVLMPNDSATFSYSVQLSGIGSYQIPAASLEYSFNGTSFVVQSNTENWNQSAPNVISAIAGLFAAPLGVLVRAIGARAQPAGRYVDAVYLILLSLIFLSCYLEFRSFGKWWRAPRLQ
jgi:hypothetical protein